MHSISRRYVLAAQLRRLKYRPGWTTLFRRMRFLRIFIEASLLKDYETSRGVFQIDNSYPMRLDISSDEEVIRFKRMEDENYGWQSDVALL